MEFRLYTCPRCGKDIKSTSGLTRHVNTCKIPITLSSCQLSIPISILEYNTTNHPDLPSNNFEEDVSLGTSNNDEEKIKPVDITGNDDKNSRPTDIDKQRPTTPNWTPWNGLLSKSSWNFREVMFSESEFPVDTPVLDTRYVHPENWSSNLFYPFNDPLDYILIHYFAKLKITKRNIDNFLSNLLMKSIIEKLSYHNTDKWMEKLSVILWRIPDNKWNKYKLELESSIDKIVGKSLTI